MRKYLPLFCLAVIVLLLSSCKKSTEEFKSATLNDYYPLQTGKYITYQLDSLVYIVFGTRDTTISYQVKYVTDSLLTDNMGRPAYRIFRFIRKSDLQPWTPNGTTMAVITSSKLEYVENNLRFQKLSLPVSNAYSWKGNSYIDTYSSNSTLQYLADWDYTYSNVGAPDMIGSFSLDNTLTVEQRDEIIGNPEDPTSYSEINYGQEKYAAGIGLVYRKFLHKQFQPGNGGYVEDGSYGVTYTMIDHN
jgi:hypothetical protein